MTDTELLQDDWAPPSGGRWDVYLDAGYLRSTAVLDGGKAQCLRVQCERGTFTYPFVFLPLSSGGGDIVSPYGYGGFVADPDAAEVFVEGRRAVREWCKQNGVVSEFIRWLSLWPLPDSQDEALEFSHDRDTFSVDLTRSDDDLEASRPASFRRSTRQARANGVELTELPWAEGLSPFEEIYTETMRRLGAGQFYYFSSDHFRSLRQNLGEHCRLIAARKTDGTIVAMALMLLGNKTAHYHLGASTDEGRALRANNVLFTGMGTWARAAGAEVLHLGGGATRSTDDSLRRFKMQVGTDEHRFFTGFSVHDRKRFNELTDAAIRQEPTLAELRGKYYQLYRHPKVSGK